MQQAKNSYLVPVLPQYQGKQSSTLIWSAFYLFLSCGLISCGSLPQSSLNALNRGLGIDVINIRDIKPQQSNYVTVYLQGKVLKQVPLLEWRVYQLQDSTGTIWVLTNKTTPQPGDEVLLKGQVRYQSIPLAGKDYGEAYVEEQQQIERSPAQ